MAPNNSLAPKQTNDKMTFSVFMDSEKIKGLIQRSIGKDTQRFTTAIISAVAQNPQLQGCSNLSILSAALVGESLQLSPSPQIGQYYIVPYGGVAQFQIGYKGYIQLAIRSGYYKKLNVLPIKEGELVYFDPIEEEIKLNLIKDDTERENAKTIGYYAMFQYTNGFRKAIYWSYEKMLAHADRFSKAFSKNGYGKKVSYEEYLARKEELKDSPFYSSFWYKDFDGMAMKTMLRQLISKWGIMSIDLRVALERDEAAIREDGSADFVDVADGPAPEAAAPAPETKTEEKAADPQPNADGQFDFFEGTDGGEQ